ncbi:hypothetical protein F5890DRAFT_1546502 [Lentinula detonsa]|uniref:Uncharacterized protein n=1 Tax=Lentinula detonsa TaxID=2804962 RepID=A0AA38PQN7_9AGAR|nr:hypothetical protein F5890DRAFT_1546502 [Lentinula detonsa]
MPLNSQAQSMSSIELTDVDLVANMVHRQGRELLKVRRDLEDSKNLYNTALDAVFASQACVEDAMKSSSLLQLRLTSLNKDLADLQAEHQATLTELETAYMDLRAVVGLFNPGLEQPATILVPSNPSSEESMDDYTSLSSEELVASSSHFLQKGFELIYDCSLIHNDIFTDEEHVEEREDDPNERESKPLFAENPRIVAVKSMAPIEESLAPVAGQSDKVNGVDLNNSEKKMPLQDGASACEVSTMNGSRVGSMSGEYNESISQSNGTNVVISPAQLEPSSVLTTSVAAESQSDSNAPCASASSNVAPSDLASSSSSSIMVLASPGTPISHSSNTAANHSKSMGLEASSAQFKQSDGIVTPAPTTTSVLVTAAPQAPGLNSTNTFIAPQGQSSPVSTLSLNPYLQSTAVSIVSPTLKATATLAPNISSNPVAPKLNEISSSISSGSPSSSLIGTMLSTALLAPVCTKLSGHTNQAIRDLCEKAIGPPEKVNYIIIKTFEAFLARPLSQNQLFISVSQSAKNKSPNLIRFESRWKGHILLQNSSAKRLYYLGEYQSEASCKIASNELTSLPEETKKHVLHLARSRPETDIKNNEQMLLSMDKDDGIYIARTELRFISVSKTVQVSLKNEAKKRGFV